MATDWIFPFRQRPDIDYTTGARRFGASRDSGNRRHAGCDLIAAEGTEILAVADGTVARGPYLFYSGTYALEVQNDDRRVVRYGEISKLVPPGVREGARVTQGQVIARVGRLESGSSMLHFELYDGSATGALTQAGNAFKRRADLIDPTPHLDGARLLGSAAVAPVVAPLAPVAHLGTGRVNNRVTTTLRIRSIPSTTGAVEFELAPGEQVGVRAEISGGAYNDGRRDWLEIEHEGHVGFGAGFFIDIDAPTVAAVGEDRWVAALRRAITTGASAVTAAQDGLAAGVGASQKMAETDVNRVVAIADRFASCAGKFGIPAALLAALASRESRCGAVLHGGWGDSGNAFGIMQVDKRFHAIKGTPDPASAAHIEQAADIFCDFLEEVARRHPDWKDEHVLKGAAVAYNSGVGNVRTINGMDQGSTGDDYGSDVVARAQYYLDHASLGQFRT